MHTGLDTFTEKRLVNVRKGTMIMIGLFGITEPKKKMYCGLFDKNTRVNN